jgi:hypothetical protein
MLAQEKATASSAISRYAGGRRATDEMRDLIVRNRRDPVSAVRLHKRVDPLKIIEGPARRIDKFMAQNESHHPRRHFDHVEIEATSGSNAKLAMRENPFDAHASFARIGQRHQSDVVGVAHDVAWKQKMRQNCLGIEGLERAPIGIEKLQNIRFRFTRCHVDLLLIVGPIAATSIPHPFAPCALARDRKDGGEPLR